MRIFNMELLWIPFGMLIAYIIGYLRGLKDEK